MNGRKAKELRRIARAETVGQDPVGYERFRESAPRTSRDAAGKITGVVTPPGSFRLLEHTTKGAYRKLKKAA